MKISIIIFLSTMASVAFSYAATEDTATVPASIRPNSLTEKDSLKSEAVMENDASLAGQKRTIKKAPKKAANMDTNCPQSDLKCQAEEAQEKPIKPQ
jgi:hypothetical protein